MAEPTVSITRTVESGHTYTFTVGFGDEDLNMFKSHLLELFEADKITRKEMTDIANDFEDYYCKF